MRDLFLFIRHAGSSESGVSSLRVLCGQSPGRGPRCGKEHQGQGPKSLSSRFLGRFSDSPRMRGRVRSGGLKSRGGAQRRGINGQIAVRFKNKMYLRFSIRIRYVVQEYRSVAFSQMKGLKGIIGIFAIKSSLFERKKRDAIRLVFQNVHFYLQRSGNTPEIIFYSFQ